MSDCNKTTPEVKVEISLSDALFFSYMLSEERRLFQRDPTLKNWVLKLDEIFVRVSDAIFDSGSKQ